MEWGEAGCRDRLGVENVGERGVTEDRCHISGLTGWAGVSSRDGTHSRILGKESRVWLGACCGHGACRTLAAAYSAS